MKKRTALLLVASVIAWTKVFAVDVPKLPPVRAAVIGGMTLSGMWPELAKQFEKETGWQVETVVTGPKAALAEVFKKGGADVLTMHASDDAADLVADGYGVNMRPWARNEHCIMGPANDPAGIRGMKNGAAALKRIAETRSPYVDFTGPGSREVSHKLWSAAGIMPKGDWVLQDESDAPQAVVQFAASKNAYVIVGRIPVLKGKIPAGKMEVLVQGDPAMRRPYVVMEANPKKLPRVNAAGAKALSDWLASEHARKFLAEFAARSPADGPLFYPVEGAGGK